MENTKIEWATHTFNPWVGCEKVSPACDHCYAEAWAKRAGSPELWSGDRRRTSKANWKKPLKWNREAMETGVRPRVFCASLADVFDNKVPVDWRRDLFALIDTTPHIDWLLLTKRIGNVLGMTPGNWGGVGAGQIHRPKLPDNVWIGATVVNQQEVDRDVPKLLAIPAKVRFLSMEPLLGPVHFRWQPYAHEAGAESYREYLERNGSVNEYEALRKLDWVIVGGESGGNARPMNPAWVRGLRDQCHEARVPFFFKQWGEWAPDCLCDTEEAHTTIERPEPGSRGVMFHCGKKNAGRRIEGAVHGEFPHGS